MIVRSQTASQDGADTVKDLAIFRTWLQQSLATYPDQTIAANTELIIDGYNVVDKRDYPARERLIAGAREGYDAVMLTGSSKSHAETFSSRQLG